MPVHAEGKALEVGDSFYQPADWKLIEKTEADVSSYEEKEIRVKDADSYEWRVAGYQRLKNGTFIYTKFNSVTNILE